MSGCEKDGFWKTGRVPRGIVALSPQRPRERSPPTEAGTNRCRGWLDLLPKLREDISQAYSKQALAIHVERLGSGAKGDEDKKARDKR